MDKVKILDKTFVPYIKYEDLMVSVDHVAEQLDAEYGGSDEVPVILCVLNGSIMFTAELMKRINFESELMSVKVKSYCGTQSTGQIRELLGLTGDVKGRRVIIVEDIIDTGYTMQYVINLLKEKGVKDCKICTLLFKPDSLKIDLDVDFKGRVIPNDFIVGFGLDYNERGRNLKDIYILEK